VDSTEPFGWTSDKQICKTHFFNIVDSRGKYSHWVW